MRGRLLCQGRLDDRQHEQTYEQDTTHGDTLKLDAVLGDVGQSVSDTRRSYAPPSVCSYQSLCNDH